MALAVLISVKVLVGVERELRTQGEEAGGGAKKFSRQISSNGTLMTRAKL